MHKSSIETDIFRISLYIKERAKPETACSWKLDLLKKLKTIQKCLKAINTSIIKKILKKFKRKMRKGNLHNAMTPD